MTEMLILPVDLSPSGMSRLGAQLEREIQAGRDLGSRHGQIACLSEAIMRSVEGLREAVILLAADLPPDDPMVCQLRDAGANMTRLAKAVMDYAALHGPITRPGT